MEALAKTVKVMPNPALNSNARETSVHCKRLECARRLVPRYAA